MIHATMVGDQEIERWMAGRAAHLQNAVDTTMARLVIKLARKVKEEKLTGQVLKTGPTGTLRRSISPEVRSETRRITGIVGTNVVYAAIHEFGGRTSPHDILPKRARALAFRAPWGPGRGEGGLTVLARVHHPGSVIPERSYLRSALREMEPEIRQAFQDAIIEVISSRRS